MGDMSYNINLEEKCQYASAKLFLQGSSFNPILHGGGSNRPPLTD